MIYMLNEPQSAQWCKQLFAALESNPALTIKGVYKIPFKPLIGIKAPAIGLEIGLKNRSDWHQYLEPLAENLLLILK